MPSYEILTLLICLAAIFSYINYKFIKWTPTIGIMALSLLTSLLLILAASLFSGFFAPLTTAIISINFHSFLMNGMLGFLLFAGSIQIDSKNLRKERLPIITLATVGILISTFLVGTLLHFIFIAFHLQISYIHCLLFAALISPTDPIAVLAILKRSGIGKSLELKIAGESLFNDGVAVVVFLTILEIAQTGIDKLSATDISIMFIREAGGGVLFGLLLGFVGNYLIRTVSKYDVVVLITIAMVMGGYMLANKLHTSGPLAMVIAGIVMGTKKEKYATAHPSKEDLHNFWELIEHILNAILFMLIGFEMLVINADKTTLLIGIITILVVLLSRWVSVALPMLLLRHKMNFEKNAIAILTWGGLRGGLSVALALSLPTEMHRDLFVSITYSVVIFSILIQGLTVGKLYKKLSGTKS